jgi:hypothetical protein
MPFVSGKTNPAFVMFGAITLNTPKVLPTAPKLANHHFAQVRYSTWNRQCDSSVAYEMPSAHFAQTPSEVLALQDLQPSNLYVA